MPMIKSKHAARERGRKARASRTGTAALLIAALAGVAILLAACGGSSSNTSPPASSGGSGASQSTADSTKAAKFAQCMRANGVPDFPDPVNGQFQLKVTKGSDLDPSSPVFQSADQACKSLQPAGFASGSSPSPQQQNQILKFVSCMRKNGVPNFPDPNSSGGVLIQGINPNSQQFKSAMQACRSLLPAGAVGG